MDMRISMLMTIGRPDNSKHDIKLLGMGEL